MVKSNFLTVLMVLVALVTGVFHGTSAIAAPRDTAATDASDVDSADSPRTGSKEKPLFGNPGTGGSMYSLGALVGMGFISSGGGTQLVIGANGDYKLAPTYGAGLYFTYNSFASISPATASVITIMPQANYYFEGMLAGLRAGAKAGIGFLRVSTGTTSPISPTSASTSDTTTSFVVGPHLGYDFALGGGLSLGGEANILFYTASSGFNAVNLLGNLKYWF